MTYIHVLTWIYREGSYGIVHAVFSRSMFGDPPSGRARADLLAQQLLHAQKVEALSRVTSVVAHDLNSIFAVIAGNIELLLQDKKRSRAQRAELIEIRHAADLGADLVRQLLGFSQSPPGAAEIIDVGATLRHFHRILARLVGGQVQVEIDAGADPVFVCLGPGLLEQVTMNLGLNARDAMPWGGRLQILVSRSGDEVLIEMSDTGAGMTRHTRDRIFEPFFTTKEPGPGTGLGLSTVHDIVRDAGGRVEIDSELGAGTRVRMFLPSAPARNRG
jgi:two-component system cell cycle sensor histidine kinase/response regulator CckA